METAKRWRFSARVAQIATASWAAMVSVGKNLGRKPKKQHGGDQAPRATPPHGQERQQVDQAGRRAPKLQWNSHKIIVCISRAAVFWMVVSLMTATSSSYLFIWPAEFNDVLRP